MPDTNITATVLRRKLRDALKSVEAGNGRVVITRHNKVVAALVSAEDLARLQAMPAVVVNVPGASISKDYVRVDGKVVEVPGSEKFVGA